MLSPQNAGLARKSRILGQVGSEGGTPIDPSRIEVVSQWK